MRNSFFVIVAAIVFMANIVSVAQNIQLESGELIFLKGQKNLKIEYVYDGMGVGAIPKEEDYISQKVNDYNVSEAGKGDKWLAAWKGDRVRFYQPAFESILNIYTKPEMVASASLSPSQYVLVVKTSFTEPGFNAGFPIQKNAMISVTYEFFDWNVRDKSLAKLSCYNIQTSTKGVFDNATRISNVYGQAGKILGIYLSKIIK